KPCLDPVSKANGLVEYARGTHQSGKLFASESFRGEGRLTNDAFTNAADELDDLPDIEANRADYDIISWDLEPGDVAIHHFRTIHGAPGNLTTATRRRGLATRFIGEDIVYKSRPGVPKPMSDSLTELAPDLADGDRLVDPIFPAVWAATDASTAS
ncbi:MAG: phytanoyl-CoA dioxygenase family protein, partial [Pseudomonadota bacterium]